MAETRRRDADALRQLRARIRPEEISIPPLYCPCPSGRGRTGASEAHRRSLEWTERSGLLATAAERSFADGNQLARGLGLAHPSSSPEAFQLLADWLLHFCLFDSHVEEHLHGPALVSACRQVMDALGGAPPAPGATSFVRAMVDLRRRMLELGGEELIARFAPTLERCFEVYVYEDDLAARELEPTPECHLGLKVRTGGFHSWWALLDILEPVRRPEETRAALLVRHALGRTRCTSGWALLEDRARSGSFPGMSPGVDVTPQATGACGCPKTAPACCLNCDGSFACCSVSYALCPECADP